MQYKAMEKYMSGIKNYVSENLNLGAAKTTAITGLAAILFATAGCASINGMAKDAKDFTGWIADITQGYVNERDERELTDAEKKREAQIEKAAEIINNRHGNR